MRRWALLLALAGCTAQQTKIGRTLGYGLAIEGGAVFLATYAQQNPHDSVGDAVVTASPLLVAGIAAIIAGWTLPEKSSN